MHQSGRRWMHTGIDGDGNADTGGARPPAGAALVRIWTKHRLIRTRCG
jgi:hypothetical protein